MSADDTLSRRRCAQLLALIDDASNDVQEIAAKCLGPLVKQIAEAHVLHIAQTLVGHLLVEDKKKVELRDISSIALVSFRCCACVPRDASHARRSAPCLAN